MADTGGWSTIESDAGVFTELVEKLGVKDVQFEELVALDPDMLRELSPIYGVIFLFKYPASTNNRSDDTSPAAPPRDGTLSHAAASSLFFAAQVIQNACGTQALLSVLLNHSSASPPLGIDVGPRLRDFKDFTSAFPADLRGEALSNSELIRDAHNAFARSSPFADETARDPTAPSEDVYHFVAYTYAEDGILYELDGLQEAPIAHGPCPNAASFPDAVVPVLQRRIARYPAHEIRFNLMALVRDPRIAARARGDYDALEREEAKRREWTRENALRRHNFLGFAAEIMKAVAKGKLEKGDAEYEAWVEGAKAATKKNIDERRTKGGQEDMDVDG